MAILATLSKAARAAYPIVQRGVREGLSSRALARVLDESGLGIRRQTLLDLMRLERGIVTAGSQLRFLNRDQIPNPFRLPEALTAIRRPFSFVVEVRGTLSSSGAAFVQPVTVTTSRLMTRAELEEQAIEAVESGADRYGMEVESAIVVRGLRAGPLGLVG